MPIFIELMVAGVFLSFFKNSCEDYAVEAFPMKTTFFHEHF